MVEKRLQDGGVAVPNIKKYYSAALLTACVDWWNLADNEVNSLLEQNVVGSWQIGLVQDEPAQAVIAQANQTVKLQEISDAPLILTK